MNFDDFKKTCGQPQLPQFSDACTTRTTPMDDFGAVGDTSLIKAMAEGYKLDNEQLRQLVEDAKAGKVATTAIDSLMPIDEGFTCDPETDQFAPSHMSPIWPVQPEFVERTYTDGRITVKTHPLYEWLLNVETAGHQPSWMPLAMLDPQRRELIALHARDERFPVELRDYLGTLKGMPAQQPMRELIQNWARQAQGGQPKQQPYRNPARAAKKAAKAERKKG